MIPHLNSEHESLSHYVYTLREKDFPGRFGVKKNKCLGLKGIRRINNDMELYMQQTTNKYMQQTTIPSKGINAV